MYEVKVDVVGRKRREPLVEHAEHFLGRAGFVLGDQDNLLAYFGRLLEPLLEAGFGAVSLGRVERANAAGVGQADQAVEHAAFPQGPRAHFEHGDFKPGLAELSFRKDGSFRRCVLRSRSRT